MVVIKNGKRAGTENVPGIIATARALAISVDRLHAEEQRLRACGQSLIAGVQAAHPMS